MAKSNKRYSRTRQQSFPWLPFGVGFLLIGLAVLLLASPKSGSQAAGQSSVVPIKVEFSAPELSLQNINGETESLSEFRGNVVPVNN